MNSKFRYHTHPLTIKRPYSKEEWRGPAMSGITAVASTHDGTFVAFALRKVHTIEIWDMSGHPSRMSLLSLPNNIQNISDCIYIAWSHRKSHIAAIYRYSTKRSVDGVKLGCEMMSVIVWSLHTTKHTYTAWLPFNVMSISFMPGRDDFLLVETYSRIVIIDCHNGQLQSLIPLSEDIKMQLVPITLLFDSYEDDHHLSIDTGTYIDSTVHWQAVSLPDNAPSCLVSTISLIVPSDVPNQHMGSVIVSSRPQMLRSSPHTPDIRITSIHNCTAHHPSADCIWLDDSCALSFRLSLASSCVNHIVVSASREKLLVSHGAVIVEVVSLPSCSTLAVFNSTSLTTYPAPTHCFGLGFIEALGLTRINSKGEPSTWIGLAVNQCADVGLSQSLLCWEISSEAMTVKSNKIHLPRKNLHSISFCDRPRDTIILGVSDDSKVWHLRQEVITHFAGPMYPPGYIVLSEMSRYIEKEDELDKKVIEAGSNESNDIISCRLTSGAIIKEEESDIMNEMNESTAIGVEEELIALPLMVMSRNNVSGSMSSGPSAVTTTERKTIIPCPVKIMKKSIESKMVKDILSLCNNETLRQQKHVELMNASIEITQREEERRLKRELKKELALKMKRLILDVSAAALNSMLAETIKSMAEGIVYDVMREAAYIHLIDRLLKAYMRRIAELTLEEMINEASAGLREEVKSSDGLLQSEIKQYEDIPDDDGLKGKGLCEKISPLNADESGNVAHTDGPATTYASAASSDQPLHEPATDVGVDALSTGEHLQIINRIEQTASSTTPLNNENIPTSSSETEKVLEPACLFEVKNSLSSNPVIVNSIELNGYHVDTNGMYMNGHNKRSLDNDVKRSLVEDMIPKRIALASEEYK